MSGSACAKKVVGKVEAGGRLRRQGVGDEGKFGDDANHRSDLRSGSATGNEDPGLFLQTDYADDGLQAVPQC